MPNELSNKKQRASNPKVRTGCITCNPNPASTRSFASGPLIRQTSSPKFETFDDDVERRSFAFFRLRTIPEISGFFPSDFWDRLVPLASFYEPALKHAVIALASLHERFENGDESILKSNNDIAEGGFALQQYNKAIRQLIQPSGKQSKPSLDTSLVACVLFACFETLRGHHGSALSHIESGVKILSQLDEDERQSPKGTQPSQLCVPRECLDVVFARLDMQRVQLLGTRIMDVPLVKKDTHPGFTADIPPQFHSLEEARNSLEYQWNLCLRQIINFEHAEVFERGDESREHRDAYDRDRRHHKKQCERWISAFQAFLDANVDKIDSKAMQGAMVLKMNACVTAMHIGVNAYDILHLQTSWDDQLPIYEELIDMATVIFDAQDTSAGREHRVKPIFQMDHSMIGNLFGIVHRCRDPYLRRRAIALLYKVPRQEGIWNSQLTARCAERIMNIEEAGLGVVTCAADIPDWARISDVDVTFDPQHRRGCIKYSRLRSFHSTVRESVTDVLEW
ncbi:MAG: hypothetical protein LQ345_006042 [Seirophora villosa]|nr:MAG: hypothetical protein LQ345_006042 [Seirophora villosa]